MVAKNFFDENIGKFGVSVVGVSGEEIVFLIEVKDVEGVRKLFEENLGGEMKEVKWKNEEYLFVETNGVVVGMIKDVLVVGRKVEEQAGNVNLDEVFERMFGNGDVLVSWLKGKDFEFEGE